MLTAAQRLSLTPACRFQYVFCQIDVVRRSLPGRIQQTLDDLPITLDATYERTLKDIDSQHQEYAQRLFQCVAVALRPLRVEELAEFFAFDFKAGPIPRFHEDWRAEDPVEAVLSTCSTLLAVVDVENSRVIEFSHFSVLEYLTSSRLAEHSDIISCSYHISIPCAHTFLTQTCLGMLLYLDKGINRDGLQKFPLAEYAAKHWVNHARFENAAEDAEDAINQLFDSRKPHFAIWVWIYDVQLPSWKRTERVEVPPPPRGTPLHYAALCGLPAILKFLVGERPQDIHCPSFDDISTPLHGAASNGHVEPARTLLECGADASAHDKDGWTPLHRASYGRRVELVRVLLDHGVDATVKDKRGSSPLHWVSSWGDVELARILLERGADAIAQDEDGSTPLHQASEGGHEDLARVLIEHGANATAKRKDGATPLYRASDRGFVDFALFLLGRGVDVTARDKDGSTPLHRASQLGHLNYARMLLEYGADVTAQKKDGSTSLDRALVQEHVEVALFLLERGADTTAQDDRGMTALHWASYVGLAELARVLLEHGANVAARDKLGRTPLHWASQRGHVDVVVVLLDGGADIMAQNERGSTPLHRASYEGQMEVSRVLLKHGAYVTAPDKFGDTPLNLAMSMGRMELARILLEGGVDVRAFVQAFLNTTTSGGGEVPLETSDGRVEVACVSRNSAAGL